MGLPQEFAAAKECFERAVARDPRLALAYDALAELHWYLGFFGFAAPADVAATGVFYAMRALEIDNALAETHALLGLYRVQLLDFDWRDAKRHYVRARELNPSSPLVRVRFEIGSLLYECRIAEAIAEMEAALQSDPLSLFMLAWYGFFLWLNGSDELRVDLPWPGGPRQHLRLAGSRAGRARPHGHSPADVSVPRRIEERPALRRIAAEVEDDAG